MRWRMRSFFIALFMTCGLAAISFGSPFDREIPAGALMYWGYDNTDNFKTDFTNYQTALKTWYSAMDDVLEWRVLKGELETIVNLSGVEEGFSALCGSESCFALYPLLEGVPIPGTVLYVAKVDDPQKAEKVLTSLFEEIDSFLPDMRSMKDEYYGYWIRSFYGPMALPGLDLAYTFKDSTLLMTNSKNLLLQCIDMWEDEEGFLAEMESYRQATANLPENRTYSFFANIAEMNGSGGTFLKNLQALSQLNVSNDLKEAMPLIEGVMGVLGAFQSFTSTRHFDSEGRLVTSSHTKLNLDVENATVRAMIERKPVPFVFERYLPRKVGTVSAGNILGPKDLWMLIQSYLPDFPLVRDVMGAVEQWEKEFNFSIENDLFAWMGDSWCLVRPVMDLESVVASNQGAVLLEVVDKEAARRGIQKLIDLITKTFQIPLLTTNEEFLGSQITSFTVPLPLIPIAPSYCIHDNVMIVSSRPSMIKEMLDIQAGVQTGIERNRQYRYLQDVAQKPANKITFQDNESEFYAFREAIRKVGSLPDLFFGLPEETRALPGFALDRAAYLMSCWQTLRGTVKRSILQNDRIETEKVSLYKDLRAIPPADSIMRRKISIGGKDLIAAWADYSSRVGNTDRAQRLYGYLSEFFPDQGDYLSHLGDLYKAAGNMKEAQAVYDRVLEQIPETAYVIGREKLFDGASADDIVSRVRGITSKTMRVREDAALFGIGLMKRDMGDSETAAVLFERAAKSENTAKAIAEKAAREISLLSNESLTDLPELSFTPKPPVIDGVMEEDLWGRSEPMTLKGDSPVDLRLLRDETNLYVLMEGSSSAKAKDFQLLLCPTRDYARFYQIRSTVDSDGNAASFIERRTIDPYDMTLSGDWPVDASDLTSNLFSFVKIIETAVEKGGVSDDDIQSLGNHQQAFPAVWKTTQDGSDLKECLETVVPLAALHTDNIDGKPVWLINAVLKAERDGQEIIRSLAGGSDASDPFECQFIRVR